MYVKIKNVNILCIKDMEKRFLNLKMCIDHNKNQTSLLIFKGLQMQVLQKKTSSIL